MKRVIVEDLRFDQESLRFRREDGEFFDLSHEPDRDLWRRDDGAVYVKNMGRISDPVWVRIDGDIWRRRYNGSVKTIDWAAIQLAPALLSELALMV